MNQEEQQSAIKKINLDFELGECFIVTEARVTLNNQKQIR
jgi:hypothetical protein